MGSGGSDYPCMYCGALIGSGRLAHEQACGARNDVRLRQEIKDLNRELEHVKGKAEGRKKHIELQQEKIRELKGLVDRFKGWWKLRCGHALWSNSAWNVPNMACPECELRDYNAKLRRVLGDVLTRNFNLLQTQDPDILDAMKLLKRDEIPSYPQPTQKGE